MNSYVEGNLYEKLREVRIKKKITQKELAIALGLTQQAVNRIEHGQRKIDVETFEKACQFLGINKIGNFSVKTVSAYYRCDNDILECPENYITEELPVGEGNEIEKGYETKFLYEDFLKKIVFDFNLLNAIGKAKALEQIEMLTKIPEYTKKDKE